MTHMSVHLQTGRPLSQTAGQFLKRSVMLHEGQTDLKPEADIIN